MTKREKLIVSVYTGYLMANEEDLYQFIEDEILHRPVLAKEIYTEEFMSTIRAAVEEEFRSLCD